MVAEHVTDNPSVRLLPDRKLTYEEYLDWLDDQTHAEWVDGEVVLMSPVTNEHDAVVGFLRALLQHWCEQRSGGVVRGEPFQMRLGPGRSGRAPDVLVVAAANHERLKRTFLDGPADLVVEVVSDDSVERDWVTKRREYAEAGVREYWIVDPRTRRAEFVALGEAAEYESLATDDGRLHSRVLDGLWLELAWFWDRPQLLEVLRAWGII